jgi:ABC-2 type transport system permease protein
VIHDVWTIMWKEWKEFLLQRGSSRKGTFINIGLPLMVFGVVVPWRIGTAYVDQPTILLMPAAALILVILTVSTDSFAGERERHTLETLLASRLSDQAILFGKVLAAVFFVWTLLVVILLSGLAVVNLRHSDGRLLMFEVMPVTAILVFHFLLSLLASCGCVFVSLKAETVRQAMQTLNFAFMGLVFAVVFALQLLPDPWRTGLFQYVAQHPVESGISGALTLALVDAALLAAARVRFRRARLILD